MINIEDERASNTGRKEWLKGDHTIEEYVMMLTGALRTIDTLVDTLETAQLIHDAEAQHDPRR